MTIVPEPMSTHEDRIHACLDGELPREALTADELHRLEALETMLAGTTAELRRVAVPDLAASVMAALPTAEVSGTATEPAATTGLLERFGRWIWSPITLTLRPAYGFVGAAALALLLLLPRGGTAPMDPGLFAAGDDGADPRMYVQFRLEVPNASQVALAGSFTEWQPEHELTEISPGVWSTMVPLEPGVYDYTFVIDGEQMVVDPYAPRVADSFGGSNSRLFLPAPNGRV